MTLSRRSRLGALAATSAVALATSVGVGIAPVHAATTAHAMAVTTAAAAPGSGNLLYRNGRVQTAPKIYVSFWGWPTTLTTAQASYQNTLKAYLGVLGGHPILSTETQYYQVVGGTTTYISNPTGQYGGAWTDTSTAPTTPTDADLARAAQRSATHFGNSSQNSLHIVAVGPGHDPNGFGTYCGWHNHTTAYVTGTDVPFVNLPYNPDVNNCGTATYTANGAMTIVTEHEISEAHTDPFLNGWTDVQGYENGDKCAWTNIQQRKFSNGQSYYQQPLWSNVDGGCAYFRRAAGPTTATASGSAGGVVQHSAKASCSESPTGPNSTSGSGSTAGDSSGIPVKGAYVKCVISTNDPQVAGSNAYENTSALGHASVSFDTTIGAYTTNSICASGTVTYSDNVTVTIPQTCRSF